MAIVVLQKVCAHLGERSGVNLFVAETAWHFVGASPWIPRGVQSELKLCRVQLVRQSRHARWELCGMGHDVPRCISLFLCRVCARVLVLSFWFLVLFFLGKKQLYTEADMVCWVSKNLAPVHSRVA